MMHHAEVTYLFRHVTLRDGAYQLHMPSERAALHELALIILESILPENDRIALALDLAVHARQAQHGRTLLDDVLAQKELAYMKVAASYAKSKYQNAEAAGHYTSAASHPSCKPVEASRMLTQAAFLYWFAGERIRCESAFEQALKLAGMDREARCDVLIERGTYYRDLGQYARAESDLMQAKKIADELGDKKLQLRSTGNLNTVLDRNIGGEAAEKLYTPLNELARDLGNLSAVGISMGQIGRAYLSEKKLDKAAYWLERSLEELRKANDGLNESAMGATLGRVLMLQESEDRRKSISQALELFRKSVTRAKDVGNLPFQIAGYVGMANCYRKLGMPLEAETYARKGLSIATEIRHESNLGSAYVALGLIYEERKSVNKAEQTYLHGLDLVQDFADRSQAVTILYALARLAAKQNDWAAAENYILTAKDQPLDGSEIDLIDKLDKAIDCILMRNVPSEWSYWITLG